jgi:hypothetical protein
MTFIARGVPVVFLLALLACQARTVGGNPYVQHVTDGQGKPVCSLTWEEVWVSVAGPAGEALGTAVAVGGVEIHDAKGAVVARIAPTSEGAEIVDLRDSARRRRLVRSAVGWSLEDAAGARLAACLRAGDAVDVKPASGTAVRVRRSGAKVVFEAEGGPRGAIDPFDGPSLDGIAWLAVEDLSIPERAALVKFFDCCVR